MLLSCAIEIRTNLYNHKSDKSLRPILLKIFERFLLKKKSKNLSTHRKPNTNSSLERNALQFTNFVEYSMK